MAKLDLCKSCFHCEACADLDYQEAMSVVHTPDQCAFYLKAMTPDEFKIKMSALIRDARSTRYHNDVEVRHMAMDNLLCEVLKSLGYEEGIAIYKTTERWYA